ncbi:MAG: hypothetical protein COU09_00420 [Candidatus Harrisonbacteria bacterium CG10_big_fil_rev_8_21_14_0_10_44_23]|uniref:Transglycosylase SLT domain-containing protein n=1 Tax=Candidatus Harrisonbacteria bacterium CG10_big_fil_rev_8_21_14_0_10_44_23 TaxID=1974585 RepID=A0A2H0UQY2_9BACT|nr:MAG: hypothetical protein COU09_00420 [Candidatus Harrisonbacteria bacterium CG10_big_fil_rev_8_21_14_0_10_44_23]
MRPKPKLCLDIKSGKAHPYNSKEARIHLSRPVPRIRISAPLKAIFAGAVAAYFILGFVVAPNATGIHAAQSSTAQERAALEVELKDLERQMTEYSNTIAIYKQQGATLQSEIDRINDKVSYLNKQIKTITLTLEKLGYEIEDTRSQIHTTESRLEKTRTVLTSALQDMYAQEQENLVTILLKSNDLSDFFTDFNDILDIQGSLGTIIREMTTLREDLLEEKDLLASQRTDALALAEFQKETKEVVLSTKQQKDSLLAKTKGEEKKYQEYLVETQKKAADIRQRIFTLLGGGQMTFEQAYDFAKYSEGLTGTRAAFLLAILDKESALGQYVGSCTYHSAMAPGPPSSRRDDITPFLQITAELGLDPETTKVSCAISQDGAYGGAMGPSQFIPTTWMMYRNRIAALTGHTPPNPWNNGDAFVATGLYIADALSACSQFTGVDQERCAAARYYAGGNWQRHLYTYGERVVNRAAQFEEDIRIISE